MYVPSHRETIRTASGVRFPSWIDAVVKVQNPERIVFAEQQMQRMCSDANSIAVRTSDKVDQSIGVSHRAIDPRTVSGIFFNDPSGCGITRNVTQRRAPTSGSGMLS